MEVTQEGKFTVEEFMRVFLDADNILRQKLKNSEKYIETYQKQKKDSQQQLE